MQRRSNSIKRRNEMHPRRRLCAALLIVVGAGAVGHLTPCTRRLVSFATDPTVRRSARLEAILVDLAMTAVATAVVVLCVSGLGVALAAGHSKASLLVRFGCALAPRWWRIVVVTACGVSLAAPGLAHGDARQACPTRCQNPLVGLSVPDLPNAHDPRIGDVDRTVVVDPGDSLWAIAATVHRANRDVIGDDPDLIFPGTHLTVPGGTHDPHHLDPQSHRPG
jgi:nucleoid-associated protein YgaU